MKIDRYVLLVRYKKTKVDPVMFLIKYVLK